MLEHARCQYAVYCALYGVRCTIHTARCALRTGNALAMCTTVLSLRFGGGASVAEDVPEQGVLVREILAAFATLRLVTPEPHPSPILALVPPSSCKAEAAVVPAVVGPTISLSAVVAVVAVGRTSRPVVVFGFVVVALVALVPVVSVLVRVVGVLVQAVIIHVVIRFVSVSSRYLARDSPVPV